MDNNYSDAKNGVPGQPVDGGELPSEFLLDNEFQQHTEGQTKLTFDDILVDYVGEFGPYQKFVYVLACVPSIAAAYMTFMPVFIMEVPKFR